MKGVPSSRGFEGGFAASLMEKDLHLALQVGMLFLPNLQRSFVRLCPWARMQVLLALCMPFVGKPFVSSFCIEGGSTHVVAILVVSLLIGCCANWEGRGVTTSVLRIL